MSHITEQHVSQRAKEEARGRIVAKLDILERWAKAGLPYLRTPEGLYITDVESNINQEVKQLDYFPYGAMDQFFKWDGSQNCLYTQQEEELGDLHTTPRKTVMQHMDLVERLELLVGDKRKGMKGLLLLRAEAQIAETSGELAQAKAELAAERTMNANTQREFIRYRTEINDLKDDLAREKKIHAENLNLGQKQLKNKDTQISLLREEVARLTQQLNEQKCNRVEVLK
ncbi:hypothetical protein [Photobacterium sanguinicancri]|uniref:hypothetical protein n=1 Tax=Photobacterium sanguinicancri TaxID=875932 RepID=UPI003D145F2E